MIIDMICLECDNNSVDFAATDSFQNSQHWDGEIPKAGLHLGNLPDDVASRFREGGHYKLTVDSTEGGDIAIAFGGSKYND